MQPSELARFIDRSRADREAALAEMDLEDRERLKIRLVMESARLIREDGAEGFSLRRVAEASSTSTQMIYTLFGGKKGLIRALWEASFELLAYKCRRIPDELSPLQRLLKVGEIYRQTALEDPVIYDALFGGPVSGFRPPDPEIPRRTEVFRMIVDCVRECMETGLLEADDPDDVAEILWAVAHGVIDFEIAGYYDNEGEGRKHFMTAQRAVLRGFGGEDVRDAAASKQTVTPTSHGTKRS